MSSSPGSPLLASGSVAKVELCNGCHCASLHLGPVTLRLDANALRDVTATLVAAVRELDRRQHPALGHQRIGERGQA
jgi:hypothetical protein